MKIKPDYKLREIAGEAIIVSQGKTGVNLTRVISLNASARLLYERLEGKEFTMQDVADVLTTTYQIAEEQARKDAAHWMNKLMECGVITE